MTESLMMNILAAGISVGIVLLFLPYFNRLTERTLSLSLFSEPQFWAGLVGIFILGAFLAGLYPALVLSSFKPMLVLKGRYGSHGGGLLTRKVLVVFQFTASVALMAGTLLIHSQLRFMRNMDLGVDIGDKIVLRGPGLINDTTFREVFRTFKTEVNRIAGIDHLTSSSNIPGDEIFWASGVRRADEEQGRGVIYAVGMDEDYLPAFGIEPVAGRNFSPSFGTEDLAIILNESAMEFLGYPSPDSAIGQRVHFHGEERHVVGVIPDYHQMSVKQEPIPLLYRYFPASDDYFIMTLGSEPEALIGRLEEVWDRQFRGNPFETFYLDEFYDRQYRLEDQLRVSVGFFALIGILIAALGLFGLSSYAILQRTKEIGIRKVNGASSRGILLLLSRDYLLLIALAITIATPVTWWFTRNWLQSFPYRQSIQWWIFLIAGLAALVIALAAVNFQTIRASNQNPSESLKYE